MAALVEKERLSKLNKIRNIDTDLRLVQWLDMHKTDPYPTKLEKKWLACDSGKTVGQIEGWFSNAAVHKITTYCEKGEGPSLLGRNWLSAIKLDWQQIFKDLHYLFSPVTSEEDCRYVKVNVYNHENDIQVIINYIK